MNKLQVAWMTIFTAVLVWSGIGPHDYPTWLLEVTPAIIAAAVLWYTRERFPLTRLVYVLILLHCIILMIGGHYTYAEVPLFNWIRDSFDLARNHYDRLAHLVQGFVPAILAREILLRKSPLRPGGWLFLIVTSICLAFSALYEMLEWLAAVLSEEAAASFLGTQGDHWDTQWDMFLALNGAMLSQFLLSRPHDRALASLLSKP